MSAASAAAAATSASYIISLKSVILPSPINQCHQYYRLHLICLLHLHCRYQKETYKLQLQKNKKIERKKERKKKRNPSVSHNRIVANLLQHEDFGGETFLQEEKKNLRETILLGNI